MLYALTVGGGSNCRRHASHLKAGATGQHQLGGVGESGLDSQGEKFGSQCIVVHRRQASRGDRWESSHGGRRPTGLDDGVGEPRWGWARAKSSSTVFRRRHQTGFDLAITRRVSEQAGAGCRQRRCWNVRAHGGGFARRAGTAAEYFPFRRADGGCQTVLAQKHPVRITVILQQ